MTLPSPMRRQIERDFAEFKMVRERQAERAADRTAQLTRDREIRDAWARHRARSKARRCQA